MNNDRVTKLLEVCRGRSPLLILTHNNPDPDALASAWALKLFLEGEAGIRSKIAYGGILGREENRSFNKLLKIGAVRLRSSHLKKFPYFALVDCQPGSGNNPLSSATKVPLIVIDHHPRLKITRGNYLDIQPDCGATATILVEYFRAAELKVSDPLATALYYGLVSETQHLGREVTRRDIVAAIYLFPHLKHRLISRIEHPVQNREYFQQLHSALEKTFTYQKFVGARLDDIQYPDFVAQLADLLITLKRATWCFVTGTYRETLYCSLRTTHQRAKAGKMLRRVISSLGSGGGHDMIAGGQVPLRGKSEAEKEEIKRKLFRQLYRRIGLPEEIKPNPLIEDDGA